MEPSITILFIGLSNSGKTTIAHSILNKQQQIFPTAGFEINYITYGIKPILVYDCSGEGWNRQNWKLLGNVSDCIVYVIDAYDVSRFSIAKLHLMKFLQKNKQNKKKNLCIMLNKADLKNRPPKELLYQALEVDKIQKYVSKVYVKETSAYNKQGLDQCLDWILKSI